RIISPFLLELTLVTGESPGRNEASWNFVTEQGQCRPPGIGDFSVSATGHKLPVKEIGFKRYVLYAPLKQRDLHVGNYLYLRLGRPVGENQDIEVKNPSDKLWPASMRFTAKADPLRWNPAVHVNQTGYLPDGAKQAMVGF